LPGKILIQTTFSKTEERKKKLKIEAGRKTKKIETETLEEGVEGKGDKGR